MAAGTAFKSVVRGLFPETPSLRQTLGGGEIDSIDEGILPGLKDPELVLGPQGVASMMQKVNPEAKATMEKEMKLAYNMMYRGESMANIEARTGFFFDDQGKIRKEIDDNAATITKPVADLKKEKEYNLNEVFDHKPFFTIYPDLANTRIRFYKGKGSDKENGFFDIQTGLIGINTNKSAFIDEDPKAITDTIRTVLHESQHLIQKIEGLETGGNPAMYRPGGEAGLNLSESESFKRYLKLIGEAEARNVAFRYGKKNNRDFLKTLATDPTSVKNNINKYRLIKGTGVPYRSVEQQEPVNLDYQDPFTDSDLFERTIR
jgi:hypothetical protein